MGRRATFGNKLAGWQGVKEWKSKWRLRLCWGKCRDYCRDSSLGFGFRVNRVLGLGLGTSEANEGCDLVIPVVSYSVLSRVR